MLDWLKKLLATPETIQVSEPTIAEILMKLEIKEWSPVLPQQPVAWGGHYRYKTYEYKALWVDTGWVSVHVHHGKDDTTYSLKCERRPYRAVEGDVGALFDHVHKHPLMVKRVEDMLKEQTKPGFRGDLNIKDKVLLKIMDYTVDRWSFAKFEENATWFTATSDKGIKIDVRIMPESYNYSTTVRLNGEEHESMDTTQFGIYLIRLGLGDIIDIERARAERARKPNSRSRRRQSLINFDFIGSGCVLYKRRQATDQTLWPTQPNEGLIP